MQKLAHFLSPARVFLHAASVKAAAAAAAAGAAAEAD